MMSSLYAQAAAGNPFDMHSPFTSRGHVGDFNKFHSLPPSQYNSMFPTRDAVSSSSTGAYSSPFLPMPFSGDQQQQQYSKQYSSLLGLQGVQPTAASASTGSVPQSAGDGSGGSQGGLFNGFQQQSFGAVGHNPSFLISNIMSPPPPASSSTSNDVTSSTSPERKPFDVTSVATTASSSSVTQYTQQQQQQLQQYLPAPTSSMTSLSSNEAAFYKNYIPSLNSRY